MQIYWNMKTAAEESLSPKPLPTWAQQVNSQAKWYGYTHAPERLHQGNICPRWGRDKNNQKPRWRKTNAAGSPRHYVRGITHRHGSHTAAQQQLRQGRQPAAPHSCHFRLLSPENTVGRLGSFSRDEIQLARVRWSHQTNLVLTYPWVLLPPHPTPTPFPLPDMYTFGGERLKQHAGSLQA